MGTSSVQPLVTVVTPSLNQGEFIEKTIKSIKYQTYTEIEHIIVDGGSIDGTIDLLKQHESTYNLRWISEPDQGMYDAINKGLRLASGEIYAYLNCDDYYLPWTVATAVRHLQGCQLIFGDAIRYDLCGDDTGLLFSPPFIFGYYSSGGAIVQPTVFFRREVFDRIGEFDGEAFPLIADCDYWLSCAAAGFRPEKVAEFLVVETEHPLAQRFRCKNQLRDEMIKLGQKYMGRRKMSDWIINPIVKYFYWRLALISYKVGIGSRWQNLKSSDVVTLGLKDCMLELLPKRLRYLSGQRMRFNCNSLWFRGLSDDGFNS
ncbi:MAG: glycosyltransferase [Deltaproteobacteria bacterium]|nr:glycosyltransferase [Deltaproteobacteria bacterium]